MCYAGCRYELTWGEGAGECSLPNGEKPPIDAMCEINDLHAENAKLREEVEQWHRLTAGIELPEYPITEFHPKDLERENAKLQELVWDLYCLAYPSTVEWEVSDATYDKYSPCEKCHELHGGKSPCAGTAKDMTEECCAPIQASVVADRMRELGVEVD